MGSKFSGAKFVDFRDVETKIHGRSRIYYPQFYFKQIDMEEFDARFAKKMTVSSLLFFETGVLGHGFSVKTRFCCFKCMFNLEVPKWHSDRYLGRKVMLDVHDITIQQAVLLENFYLSCNFLAKKQVITV